MERLIAKKLHIDTDKNSNQDFEAWFDGTNGLKINNNGEEIFKVDRNGNVFMKNATLRDGIFTGEIYSGPLELINRAPESKVYSFKRNTAPKNVQLKYLGRELKTQKNSFEQIQHRQNELIYSQQP